MAQHLLINDKYVGVTDEETKEVRKIVRKVRDDLRKARENDTEFGSEYIRLPDDYLEGTETEGYVKHIDTSESLVYGGRASVELRFRMSILSKIFLVA